MRKLTIATLAALSMAGGALALSPLAAAQPAPPPAPPAATSPATAMPMHPMALGPGPHPWMHNREMRDMLSERLRTWGLFHRPADLALSPDDVKVIGEAILLRNGQHDWKVGDVTPNADNTVSFAFVTAHGDVVARFSINIRTGRITRTD